MGKEKLTVKQWRNLLGQTQKEFANNIGMKLSTYKDREAGKTEWNGSELVRLSMYLGKSLDTEISFTD